MPSLAESDPCAKTEGWVYNTTIQGFVSRCRKITDCRNQVLERTEFTRGQWFSECAGEEESLFGFLALESDIYSSGAISEATTTTTQARQQGVNT